MKVLKFFLFTCLALLIVGVMSVRAKKDVSIKGAYKEGQILVRFKPNVSDQVINSIVKSLNARILISSRVIKDPIVPDLFLLKVDDREVPRILEYLNSRPEVLYAEPDYYWRKLEVPNDPEFPKLWGLHNNNDADIDAPEAWDINKGSKSVIVAVVDTGVDYTHPDLARNMWRNRGEIPSNGLDDDNNGVVDDVYGINTVGIDPEGPGCGGRPTAGDPMDDDGHGTHVAGTIGAYGNNNLGVVGVNWNISIMAVKFLGADGAGTTSAAILGLQYVKMMKDRGYNIIATNNSWGGGAYSRALYDAIEALMASGILFIAAAGNNGANNNLYPAYPASYDLPNIIAVAATNSYDQLAYFSNYGNKTVHVGAPGVNILSTCSSALLNCKSSPDYPYAYMSGTSMATPHVTGLAALLKAQNPNRTWVQIKNLILSSGDNLSSLSGKTITDRRINAYKALNCTNYSVFAPIRPFDESHEYVNRPVVLRAINVRCASPAGNVTVTVNGTIIRLIDNGTYPDRVANDGEYAGVWTPNSPGRYILNFSNGLSNKTIAVNVGVFNTYSISTTAHSFTDISSQGIKLPLGDEGKAEVDIPFPVSIYNRTFTKLFISPNGALSYNNVTIGYYNHPIPTSSYPNLIAPFWDDFYPDPQTDNAVFYRTLGTAPNRRFIVQWNNVPHYNLRGTNGVTFQVEFLENSSQIYFRYKDVIFGHTNYDRGASATVGIQKDGTEGTRYSYNNPSLNNNTSLVLIPTTNKPILHVEPTILNFYRVPVGGNMTNRVYVYNTGSGMLTISNVTINGTSEFTLVSPPNMPVYVSPGGMRSFTIRYSPINNGSDTASLRIITNAGNRTVTLQGAGYYAPDIHVSPSALNFGVVSVNGTSDRDLIVSNRGNTILRITDIEIESPFSVVSPTTLPIIVSPGGNATIRVRFNPTSAGTYWSEMIIYSNDPDESAVKVRLTGIAR